jgi:Escherichia/Staphylococcus phage prohead protease
MDYLSGFSFAIKELDAMGEIEGYASTFGKTPDRQGDVVKRGAFAQSIEETKGKFPLLMGHDTGRIAGFATGAEEDGHGLKIRGQLALDADEGRNAYAIARLAHQLNTPLKMSIGYMIREGGSEWDKAGRIRTLTAIDLLEVSFVAVPANPRAMVTGVKGEGMTTREFETFLRDSGHFSKDKACTIASHVSTLLGDRGDPDNAGVKDVWMAQIASIASEARLTKFLEEII